MSNGRFCFIRDLGLVKGGKGLKHHEVVLELSWRGLVRFAAATIAVNRTDDKTTHESETQLLAATWVGVGAADVQAGQLTLKFSNASKTKIGVKVDKIGYREDIDPGKSVTVPPAKRI